MVTRKRLGKFRISPVGVMPAKAGIQSVIGLLRLYTPWIPAFAGMTVFYRAVLVLLLTALPFSPLSAAQLSAELDKKTSPMGEPLTPDAARAEFKAVSNARILTRLIEEPAAAVYTKLLD